MKDEKQSIHAQQVPAGLVDAARSVLRDALDAVEVHPCDVNDDAVRAKSLHGSIRALYDALSTSPANTGAGEAVADGEGMIKCLRGAMDSAAIPVEFRSPLIGYFCNEFNRAIVNTAPAPVAQAIPDLYERLAEAHDASLDDDHRACRAILTECMSLLAHLAAPGTEPAQCPHGVDDGGCKACYHEATKPALVLKRLTNEQKDALLRDWFDAAGYRYGDGFNAQLAVNARQLVCATEHALATANGMTLEE